MRGKSPSIFCFLADKNFTLDAVPEVGDEDDGSVELAESGSGVGESIRRAIRWL